MSATTVMLIAWGALIVGHWSNNQPTINRTEIIEMAFATLVIAVLESTSAEPIAKGFAWLFLAAVLLRSDSVLTGLAKATGTGTAPAK
jgi:hypothetical protein